MFESEAGTAASQPPGNSTRRGTMGAETRAFLAGAQSAFAAQEFADARGLIGQAESSATLEEFEDPQQYAKFTAKARYNEAVVAYYESGLRYPKPLIERTFGSALADAVLDENREKIGDEVLSTIVNDVGAVSLFNYGVVMYQLHNLPRAQEALEYLFAQIDTLEEWLAMRICFVLLDVYLRLGIAYESKANSVLTFLDGCFAAMEPNTDEDGNAAGDEFPQVTPELREADMLKVAVLAPAQSQRDTRFLIYVYKARLKAMTDNARGFKKEAKNAVSAAEDASLHPTAAALVLKAHMEKNLRKGLAHLTGASQSATVLRPLILNNIGVIHHRLGRHALSVAYLTEAQSNFDRVLHATDGGRGGADPAQDAAEDAGKTTIYPESLPLWGLHRGPEVAYNLGVQYLMLKEFRKARQMFSIAAGHFARTSPRFWLRMAECFVGLAEERAKQYHDGLIESIVGKRSKRRAIIRSSGRGRNRMDMEMAMACAKAGLSVMSTMAAEGRGAGQASYEAPRTETHSLAPGDNAPAYEPSPDDRQRHDNLAVEAGLTLMLCFTCLECGRYEDVLAAGKRLVSLEDVPERLVNHAQTYMAKAECERGRVREALARLNPSNASDIEEKSRMWLNSAVIHLHLDQVDEARMATVQATETMNHQAGGKPTREMVLMNLYLAIREGNNGVARNILKSFEKVPVEADD